ncbi:MAG TPA: ABC transporter ATP-binding protein [Candidatus Cybelea sp.]|nr:ABC transporter ATP-binding protein [Candidatus Cybelea sp.]
MAEPRTLLALKGVSKSFGATRVLEGIDLAVEDGEFITILGPSGSGKTTILRLIGGFTQPDQGEILLDGRDIAHDPINRRPFNTVFQDYALFPHMTVAGNVGYGLKVRGRRSAEIEKRVKETLDLVQLGNFRDRYPAQLSGGQKQRVALARAIICEPRLILLDEPLAALDVELRKQMQQFLKVIHREIKTTFLFVTHDQEEAIAMADRICVMNYGKVLQLGSPTEVYYRPHSEFVARFFGDNNLIEGKLAKTDGNRRFVETSIGALPCILDDTPEQLAAPTGGRAFAVIRPEAIRIDTGHGWPARSVDVIVSGAVTSVDFGGASTVAQVEAVGVDGAVPLRVKLPSRVDGLPIRPGDRVRLGWQAADCRMVTG